MGQSVKRFPARYHDVIESGSLIPHRRSYRELECIVQLSVINAFLVVQAMDHVEARLLDRLS